MNCAVPAALLAFVLFLGSPAVSAPPGPSIPGDLTPGGPYTGRIACLLSDGDALYAGGWHMGVYRLGAKGRWTAIHAGMTGRRDVLALARAGRTLLAATFQGELFARTGGAWRLVHDFGGGRGGRRAVARAVLAEPGAWWVAAGDGVWVSRDDGKTWSRAWEGKDACALVRAPDGSLVFGTLGGGVGSCDRDGAGCAPIASFPGGRAIVALAAAAFPEPGVLVATDRGVYFTPDGRAFAEVGLGEREVYPTALGADAAAVAVALDGAGLRVRERARPAAWKPVAFPRRITAVVRHRGAVYFGTDGLGVFVVRGTSAKALNAGLLNFPESVVDDVLKGTKAEQ